MKERYASLVAFIVVVALLAVTFAVLHSELRTSANLTTQPAAPTALQRGQVVPDAMIKPKQRLISSLGPGETCHLPFLDFVVAVEDHSVWIRPEATCGGSDEVTITRSATLGYSVRFSRLLDPAGFTTISLLKRAGYTRATEVTW